jgi:hypothetical protein
MRQEPIDYESRQKADGGNCPFCRSTSVVTGKLVGGEGTTGFVADHLKSFVWTFTPFHVVIEGPAFICSECGAVWSQADAAQFRERYARWCKDSGR